MCGVLHVLKLARPCGGGQVWGKSVLVGEGAGGRKVGGAGGAGGAGGGGKLRKRGMRQGWREAGRLFISHNRKKLSTQVELA